MNMATQQQKVLIVDDAADNRQILNDLLKPDYAVLLAKHGEQGLDRALQHRPDLILLDVLMPGMSGYEVMARLQQDPRVSEIAVIFITGLDAPEDVAKGLMHGAADYISKPFNAEVVKARVAAQMRLARQQRLVLDELARTDAQTGLPNRLAFDAVLLEEHKRSEREQRPLALLLVETAAAAGPRAAAAALAARLPLSVNGLFCLEPNVFAALLPGFDADAAARLAADFRSDTALASLALRAGQACRGPGTDEGMPLLEQARGCLA